MKSTGIFYHLNWLYNVSFCFDLFNPLEKGCPFRTKAVFRRLSSSKHLNTSLFLSFSSAAPAGPRSKHQNSVACKHFCPVHWNDARSDGNRERRLPFKLTSEQAYVMDIFSWNLQFEMSVVVFDCFFNIFYDSFQNNVLIYPGLV